MPAFFDVLSTAEAYRAVTIDIGAGERMFSSTNESKLLERI